jgi:hypothetical protein
MRATLYKRLKPEFKQGLENATDRWGTAVEFIHVELKKEFFYSDLSINSISRIWLFSDVHGGYNRNGVDWKLGEDMFETEEGCA